MSKYDTTAVKVYDNEVLSIVLENQLTTALDMNQFVTVDYTMTEAPGMVKKIRTYKGTGDVEDLAMGAGNTGVIGVEWIETPFEVMTTQGKVNYYDEQEMADPDAIEKAVNHLAETMTNDHTRKIVAQLNRGTNRVYNFGYNFDGIVDAIASLPKEENVGLFLLVSRADLAKFQKNLASQLQYVEAFARTGYIGSIAGVPIYATDAVATGTSFLATKEAVTCFYKKGSTVETTRNVDTRQNTLIGRAVKVIALTNDNKVVVLKAGAPVYTAVQTPVKADLIRYFERSGSAGAYVYTLTTDTEVDSAKTYYTRN